MPKVYPYIQTEDEALNIIINSKVSVCKKEGIDVNFFIDGKVTTWIEDVDKSVLLGNLFSNAIEAVRNIEDKQILVNIQKQDEYVVMHIENTIGKSVLKENPNLLTTKLDKTRHGVGTQNIKKIVNKYHGLIDFYEKDEKFCCDIMIPNRSNVPLKD